MVASRCDGHRLSQQPGTGGDHGAKGKEKDREADARAERDGVDFNLMSIPESWDMEAEEAFDQKYMAALFALGERMGREGISWRESPQAADPEVEIAATN